MPFKNTVVAGTVLVRPAIQSPNYDPGVAGWTVNADGTAEFNGVTLRGTLQSSNFVAGTSGWQLLNTGAAELNQATIRGDVFFPTGVAGVSPGSIRQVGTELSLQGPTNPGVPHPSWVLLTQDAQMELRGAPVFVSAPVGTAAADALMWFTGMSLYVPAMDPQQFLDPGPLSTASTAFTALSAQSMTIANPPSGILRVEIDALVTNTAAFVGVGAFEVRDTNGAGALLFAASNSACARATGIVTQQAGHGVALVSGLAFPGTSFIRPMYRSSNAGNTASFTNTYITVTPEL